MDTNNLRKVNNQVKHENVIEIIDHHHLSDEIQKFTNAKLDIQKVGAAATLVAKRFIDDKIPPTKENLISKFPLIDISM